MTETKTFEPKETRPRKRRIGLWVLAVFAVMLLAIAGVAWQSLGRAINAPEWLRTRIEARIDALVPDVDISMRNMTFFVSRDLTPEVSIDGLNLVGADTGRPLLSLTRMDVKLSRAQALKGQVRAKELTAAGLFMKLRRERDGSLDITFGDGIDTSVPDVATLLTQIDTAIADPQLESLDSIQLEAITLDYQDAMSGRAWLLDGGRVSASRSKEDLSLVSDFAILSGGADVTKVTMSAAKRIGALSVELGMALEDMPAADIAAQSPALSWLGVLRAPISGSLRTGFDEAGTLLPLSASLHIGEGVLQPTDETRPIPFENARAYFTFDATRQHFDFTEVSVTSDWVSTSGSGGATLASSERGDIEGLVAQLRLEDMVTNPFGIYPEAQALDAASLDMSVKLDPFELRIGQISLQSGDLQVLAEGRARAGDEGWHVNVSARSPEATRDDVLRFWPIEAAAGARRWVDANVLGGTFSNLQFALTDTPSEEKPKVYVGAEVVKGEVKFLKTMPEMTDIDGRLVIENNQLFVVADKGTVTPAQGGQIAADGTMFTVLDLGQRNGIAEVHLQTESTVTAALSLIDNAPLSVMTKAKRPVALADGRADLEGLLRFPMKRKLETGDLEFRVDGTVEDVRSDKIVEGRTLTSPRLTVAVTPDAVRISGPGRFDGVPFDGYWESPISGPTEGRVGQVVADVEISERTLETFRVGLPSGSVTGQGTGKLTLSLPNGGTPQFRLTSNLAGVGLRIAPLGWAMSRGTTGQFEISGALSAPVRIDDISLQGPGLNGQADLQLRADGSLQSLDIRRLRVGGWLDAPVRLTSRGRGTPLAISVPSGSVDLRSAPFGKGGSGGGSGLQSGPLNLVLDNLRISDGMNLSGFKGEFTLGAALEGTFSGRLNGGQTISGRARPTNAGTAFVIRSQDAGRTVADAGIYKNLNDGRLTLRLTPTGETGTFDGEMTIREARMKNAPAVAELLNAVSIIGLLTQLNGEGIYFDEIEARFRLTPSQVYLTQSSAVGPSMGISLDGVYDIGRERIDMQGVLSPLYAINILGRAIARKGEGLIGFNFSMLGAAQNPNVTVNPLSALTPGMFRDIFRRPAPEIAE